jgi:hypothetical protein
MRQNSEEADVLEPLTQRFVSINENFYEGRVLKKELSNMQSENTYLRLSNSINSRSKTRNYFREHRPRRPASSQSFFRNEKTTTINVTINISDYICFVEDFI